MEEGWTVTAFPFRLTLNENGAVNRASMNGKKSVVYFFSSATIRLLRSRSESLVAMRVLISAVVKWLGVGYLIYLGVRQWRAPAVPVAIDREGRTAKSRRRIVGEAWLLNAVNPKGTAFMLAVVPQFLTPGEPLVPQYLAIGATLAFTDLVINAGYAAFAARLLGVLRTPARLRVVNRVFGGFFVGLGLVLATFKRA